MKQREERGPWYLLTGLILGVILGVAFAWLVQPVEYIDTAPDSLQIEFKDRYRALIAAAYMANGDIVRARARLELLDDEDTYRSLAEQAQRTLAEQGTSEEARALGVLAIEIGQNASSQATEIIAVEQTPTPLTPTSLTTASFTPTITPTETHTPEPTPTFTSEPTLENEDLSATQTMTPEGSPTPDEEGTPTETHIPRPTDTPTLTPTPSLTPGAPFVLVDSNRVCDQALPEPLIMIYAENASEEPAAGVEVIVIWDQGEERFFTGLKPEKGLGYADFSPVAGTSYTLRLGDGGEPVIGLSAVSCQNASGNTFWGAWELKFIQP